ncbi:hypothetical protein CQA89_33290, partial [Klebsiella pneumoniae]
PGAHLRAADTSQFAHGHHHPGMAQRCGRAGRIELFEFPAHICAQQIRPSSRTVTTIRVWRSAAGALDES